MEVESATSQQVGTNNENDVTGLGDDWMCHRGKFLGRGLDQPGQSANKNAPRNSLGGVDLVHLEGHQIPGCRS